MKTRRRQKKELPSALNQFANPKVRHTKRGNELRQMKNTQKRLLIHSVESDLWCACVHTMLLTGRRMEQETAKVREHAGTQQTEALLPLLFYFLGPNFPIHYAGEGTMKRRRAGRGGAEKWREKREIE